ncbi:hypothetical protein [Streptomyces sp. NPDC058045]
MTTAEFPGLDDEAATGGRKRKLVLFGTVLSLAVVMLARRKR